MRRNSYEWKRESLHHQFTDGKVRTGKSENHVTNVAFSKETCVSGVPIWPSGDRLQISDARASGDWLEQFFTPKSVARDNPGQGIG